MVVNAAVVLSNAHADAASIQALMGPENTAVAGSMLVGLILVVGIVFFFCSMVHFACDKRKSKEYREKIADMYVVGVIKNFAQKDNVDIESELLKFEKDVLTSKKERKRQLKELDEVVEDHLKEKVDLHEKELMESLESSKRKDSK